MNARRYFYPLDAIRGVAAIFIVLLHMPEFFGFRPASAYLAVDLFFALSGVVIANSYEARLRTGLSLKEFFCIRWARLYPLYILGSAISVLGLFLGVLTLESTSRQSLLVLLGILMLPDLASSRTLYPLNVPAWSLFFELGANILYARYLRLLTSNRLRIIVLLSALGLLGTLQIYGGLDAGSIRQGVPGAVCRVGYSFSAGILLYRACGEMPFRLRGSRAGFALVAILGVVAGLLLTSPSPTLRPYFDFFTVVILFPALIYCSFQIQPGEKAERICKFLGGVSYAVYAIHRPLGDLVRGIPKYHFGVVVGSYAPQIGFCFLVLLLGLGWLGDAIYDQPFRRFLLGALTTKLRLQPKLAQ